MPALGKEVTQATGQLGLGAINATLLISFAIWFLATLILAGIAAWISYIWITKKKYNITIRLFAKINGRIEEIGSDRAIKKRLGKFRTNIIHMRKNNLFLPMPSIQTGRNAYWYYLRSDGELINFGMQDMDAAMKKMNAVFTDMDMRYAHTSLHKQMKEQYQEQSFLQKWGGVIMWIALILVAGLIVVMWLGKVVQISSILQASAEISFKNGEITKEILTKLDGLISRIELIQTQSGIVSVIK